jgi:predicted phosphodiesterase
MTLALLYDIHGNLPALEAVLGDAEAAGAERFVLGGDYAAFGAWPRGTVERLKELDAEWIRGNVDRWTVDPAEAPDVVRPALGICRELLGEELAAELAGLPPTLTHEGVLYCHGSPRSDTDGFMPEPADGEDELLEGVDGGRLVFGHTHLQFTRIAEKGVELLNPGSVGIPLDGDRRAAYALVGADGAIDLRRVAYDHAASAAAIRERLGEAGELPARRVEQARFDVG